MRVPRCAVAALLAFAWALQDGPARACDSTGCLIQTRGSGLLRKGGFSLDLSYRYLDQSKPMSGRAETPLVSRPRVDYDRGRLLANYHRDLDSSHSGIQIEAAFGIGLRTTLYASAPVLTLRSHQVGHGNVVTPYETWGVGDAVFGARQAIGLPFAGTALASLALKLPTAKTGLIDDFDQRPLDPMLQPGSGSLDVLFSGQYSRLLSSPRLDVSLSVSYQANTTNERGYRFGNEAIASLGLSRPLGRSFAVSATAKWMREGRDGFLGQAVSSTGMTVFYLNGGLRLFQGPMVYYAVAQLPVHRYVNETQLAPKTAVLLGVSRGF